MVAASPQAALGLSPGSTLGITLPTLPSGKRSAVMSFSHFRKNRSTS